MKAGFFTRMRLKQQLLVIVAISLLANLLVQAGYFLWLRGYVQNKAEESATVAARQLEQNMRSRMSGIFSVGQKVGYNRLTQQYLMAPGAKDALSIYTLMSGFTYDMVSVNNDIAGIAITADGQNFNSVYSSIPLGLLSELSAMNVQSVQTTRTFALRQPQYGAKVFAMVMPIYYIYGLEHRFNMRIGTAVILCKTGEVLKTMQVGLATHGSVVCTLDAENDTLAATSPVAYEDGFQAAAAQALQNSGGLVEFHFDGQSWYLTRRTIPSLGWNVLYAIPKRELMADLYRMAPVLIVSLLAFTGALLPLAWLMIRNITTPFQTIVNGIEASKSDGVKFRLNLEYPNEIGEIAGHIDTMMENAELQTRDIVSMQARVYETELSKKQAELNALRSQINPHFLYNTLECMKSMGVVYGATEVVQVCTALSRLFRYSVKGEDLVNLCDELEAVRCYIDIMNIRFTGRFQTEITASSAALARRMPKMILQPLVENAFEHGLESIAEGGVLKLEARAAGKGLLFDIWDNGAGMEAAQVERIRAWARGETEPNREHLGLYNTIQRLRLYYDDGFTFDVQSAPHAGTRFLIAFEYGENKPNLSNNEDF